VIIGLMCTTLWSQSKTQATAACKAFVILGAA